MTKPVILKIDGGVGMTRDLGGRPFFTREPVGEGAGLNPGVARRILTRRHGEHRRVDSKLGQTRFAIWLPVGPKIRDGG